MLFQGCNFLHIRDNVRYCSCYLTNIERIILHKLTVDLIWYFMKDPDDKVLCQNVKISQLIPVISRSQ